MNFGNIIRVIKDYFTANIYRKIFFFCMGISIVLAVISAFVAQEIMLLTSAAVLVIAITGSLIESMTDRVEFCRRVVDIQREHYEKVIKSGEDKSPEGIPATFTVDEYNYVKKKKRNFVLWILFKAALILILFTLLFSQ
jgi:hypothetical protein